MTAAEEAWYRLDAGQWIGPYASCRDAVADAVMFGDAQTVEDALAVLERRLCWGQDETEELPVFAETVEAALAALQEEGL